MARRRRRHRTGDPLVAQAQLESRVRYQPELQALDELLHEARQDLRTGIAADTGAAAGIQAAVDAARPEVTKVYRQAAGSLRDANRQLAGDLASLSSSADPYRAVAAREAAGAKNRLADALAGAQSELQQRKVGAEAGRAYATRAHLASYQQTAEKIGRQRVGVRAQAGAFTQATVRDLRSQQAAQDFKAAGQAETQRHNLVAEAQGAARIRQGARSNRNADKAALSKHQKIVGDIQDAASLAKAFRDRGASADLAVRSISSPKSKDNPRSGPSGGYGPYTTRAAVSLVYNGRIAPHLLGGLRARGLILHRTSPAWQRPPRPHGLNAITAPIRQLLR